MKSRREILRISRDTCADTIAFLELEPTNFLCVDRLRVLRESGVSISLERSRSPWREAFGDTLDGGLLNGSLGETLIAAGLTVESGEEWAQVLPALSRDDAVTMARTPGEPMLHLRRVTRTAGGDIIEYVESIFGSDAFRTASGISGMMHDQKNTFG